MLVNLLLNTNPLCFQVPGIYKIRYVGQTTLSSAAVGASSPQTRAAKMYMQVLQPNGVKHWHHMLANLLRSCLSCRSSAFSWELGHYCIVAGNDNLIVAYCLPILGRVPAVSAIVLGAHAFSSGAWSV